MEYNLKVGQKVYLSQHKYRCTSSTDLREAEIIKIGKKWFYIDERRRFNVETLQHDGGKNFPQYDLYLSEQEYNDIKEKETLNSKFSVMFRYNSKLPLDKLRRINQIINE